MTRHDAGTVLWTAGVAAPPVAAAVATATGAEQDRAGRIMVGDADHPRPPGDLRDRRHDEPGQAARGGRGRHAGRPIRGGRIRREVTGHRPPSRSATTTWARPPTSPAAAPSSRWTLHLGGFVGWVVWLFIHIGFLTGFRNRFGAVVSWWFAFTRDLRRERTFTTEQVGLVHSAYDVLPSSAAGTALPGSTSGAELPCAGKKLSSSRCELSILALKSRLVRLIHPTRAE